MNDVGAGPRLGVRNLYKTFGEDADENGFGLKDVGFEVPEGKLFTILGPSGCGKTTTLRCIAGLETPDSGEIRLGDRLLFSSQAGVRVRPDERRIGMVFQSYAIWPHMSVVQNVAFPLQVDKSQRRSRGDIRRRVDEVLAVVGLEAYADRRATDLSGGQQQRLALARAIVIEPPLLLLDEPLSNLDAKLREQLRLELKRLQREVGVTAVYVTHDQVEALAISNWIAVMNDGVIQQVGEPREIYENPGSRFVAEFIGSSNLMRGAIRSKEGSDSYLVETSAGPLRATSDGEFTPGSTAFVSIRPENVTLEVRSASSLAPNSWPGVVVVRGFIGEAVDHLLQVGDIQIRARCNPQISIPQGTQVAVSFPAWACSLIPDDASDG